MQDRQQIVGIPPEESIPRRRILGFIESIDHEDLILRYDVDFDVPLQHRLAIGVLRMNRAFDPAAERTPASLAIRTGAYWCDIVRADIEYHLLDGLRLIEESQTDAQRLHDLCVTGDLPDDVLSRYVTARWFDGTGKIRYRLGSYALARMDFQRAAELARSEGLWWCLPDLESDLARAAFEEHRQASAASTRTHGRLPSSLRDLQDTLSENLGDLLSRFRDIGEDCGIDVSRPAGVAKARHREFLRGYSNLLHNHAVALRQQNRLAETRRASQHALSISRALGDEYRIAQALNHQAQLSEEQAEEYYEQLKRMRWARGVRLARQQLAKRAGREGIPAIQKLLSELCDDTLASGRQAGMDIDVYAYTVNIYKAMVAQADERHREELAEDLSRREMAMARSVRRVVAIPAFKRAYAVSIRPTYLNRIARDLADATRTPEDILALAEESSAREILDMISTSPITADVPPPSVPADLMRELHGLFNSDGRGPAAEARRGGLRCAPEDARIVNLLAERESHFEDQFLRNPLAAAPDDPEIAHQVKLFAANNPDTCIVRYFLYGENDALSLGAFVIKGTRFRHVVGLPYDKAQEVEARLSRADRAPVLEDAEQIWDLLIEPVWAEVNEGGPPGHLVLIPVDALFNIPLHIAARPAEREQDRGVPLAARLPLSHSVSVTAFVARGRHLLRRQPVDPDDHLAAIVPTDESGQVSANEIANTGWDARHIVIAGRVPTGLQPVDPPQHPADWAGIAAIADVKPEFFVYAGHGCYDPAFQDLGAFLMLDDDVMTHYDFALRLRLPRNKLAVLSACVAGRGALAGGGEVSGFLRALMATGAGAIGITLWPVKDSAMVKTVRALLADSRYAVNAPGRTFDVAGSLHRHYRDMVEDEPDLWRRVDQLPVALYL